MSLHDTYARVTPFELAFGDIPAAEALAVEVAEEAAGRGADATHPHAFVTMESVERFARQLASDDEPEHAGLRYGPLAYHGVNFVRAGLPLYLLTTHATRYLVGGTPGGTPELPAAAGYLQLPQHLFWASAESGAPESVDGIFWSAPAEGTLQTLLVTGLHAGGEGLGIVPLPAAPLSDSVGWLDVDARGDGHDFESDLPGSEIEGLYALRTAGEALKLLARFFAYSASVSDALVPVTASAVEIDPATPGPRPSTLDFTRVILHG